MDWLTFIADIVSSIVWPVFFGLMIVFLVNSSSKWLPYVRQIKYQGLEVEFRELKEKLDQAGLVSDPNYQFIDDDKIIQLAKIDTRAAVSHIWISLEEKIIQLIQHNGLIRFTTPIKFVHVLRNKRKISEEELEVFEDMRKLRNRSLHPYGAEAPTISEVLEFRDSASAFSQRLEEIKGEEGYVDLPR